MTLSPDQCLRLCWREGDRDGCYQNSGRCVCRSVSCWLVSGSGTLHTFAHTQATRAWERTHTRPLTLQPTRTHARTHTVGILLPPSSCPWAWQSGHGRYQREGEAWKQRPSLWVRSVYNCESTFVGDKMAMSEQLENEGGKSLFLTFSLLSFSQSGFSNKTAEVKQIISAEKNVFFDVSLGLLVFRDML